MNTVVSFRFPRWTAPALVCLLAAAGGASATPAGMKPRFNFNGADVGTGLRTDDPAVYQPDTGRWHILHLTGGLPPTIVNWGWNESQPVPGDYDGDGKSDLAVFHADGGNWIYLSSQTGVTVVQNWGWNQCIPVPGDYDGDGKTDFAVYWPDGGTWFVQRSSDGVSMTRNWGWKEAVPVPADYDGDGKTDFAVYHRAGGNWFILSATDLTLGAPINWGWNQAWPVPADYDGDGRADLAVYQREAGNWFIAKLDRSPIAMAVNWGWVASAPVPGDYDGDGRADLAVYHRASGNWFIAQVGGTKIAMGVNQGGADRCPIQSYASPGTEGVTYVSFGDSITYGSASSTESPLTGYPFLLEKKLKVYYGGSFRSVNAGVPGEMTFAGVNRSQTVINANGPDAFLLMEGTNDSLYDGIANQTEANLRYMVQYALNRGIYAVIATIPPVIRSAYRDRTVQHARIINFNPRIHGIGGRFGIPVALVYEEITAVPGWDRLLIQQLSANHPNDAGYLRVRDAFYKTVAAGLLNGTIY